MNRNYLSYLLRIWQTGSSETPTWVASLEDPHTRQVTHFKNLEGLAQYLVHLTQQRAAVRDQDGQAEEKEV